MPSVLPRGGESPTFQEHPAPGCKKIFPLAVCLDHFLTAYTGKAVYKRLNWRKKSTNPLEAEGSNVNLPHCFITNPILSRAEPKQQALNTQPELHHSR